jgi:Secretion system C-terminal sorting domain
MTGDLAQSNYGGYDFYLIELTTDLGLEETEKKLIDIYPNPANDHVVFDLTNSNNLDETVLIFTQDGKLIETLKFDVGSTKLTWNPTVLSGIYFYRIGEQTGKIILNR